MGLYGSSKAPAAPDPVKTAQAQTSSNISTAIANAQLGNVDQITPDGSLKYTSTSKFVEDPTSGQTFWRGPNGEIQSSAPMVQSMSAGGTGTKSVPYYEEGTGKLRYRQETVSTPGKSTSTPAEGWTQVKGNYIPQYTATTTLSPQQQAIKDQEDAASLNLATTANTQSAFLKDYLGKGVDTSKLPARQYSIPGAGQGIKATVDPTSGSIQYGFGDAGAITKSYGDGDYETGRKTVEDAMYARLNPQIDRDRAALETSLANQGIRVGSTAYSAAMDDFNRGVSDQRTSITLAGGQEQSRLAGLDQSRAAFQNAAQQQTYDQLYGRANFNNSAQGQEYGQNLQSAAFQNSAQQQKFNQNAANVQLSNSGRDAALNEAYAARNQPINEIAALMNGAQVNQPQFVSTNMPSIANTDYAGIVQQDYANRMAAYQQQQASKNSMIGGLFSLGSSAIMASDRRLKTGIREIGRGPLGLAIYAFRYISGGPERRGVMAQDVAKVLPEAVVRMADGFLAVDYGKVFAEGAA